MMTRSSTRLWEVIENQNGENEWEEGSKEGGKAEESAC